MVELFLGTKGGTNLERQTDKGFFNGLLNGQTDRNGFGMRRRDAIQAQTGERDTVPLMTVLNLKQMFCFVNG